MVVLLDSCSNRSTPSFSSPADAGQDRSGGLEKLERFALRFLLQARAPLTVPGV
jgi:hypothetical protein